MIITYFLLLFSFSSNSSEGLCSRYSENYNKNLYEMGCSKHSIICPGQQVSSGACYFKKEYYIQQTAPGGPRSVIRKICRKSYYNKKLLCKKKVVLFKSKNFDASLKKLAQKSCEKFKNSPRDGIIMEISKFIFLGVEVVDELLFSSIDFTTKTFCDEQVESKYDFYFKLKAKYNRFSGPDQKLLTRDLDILFCLSSNC